MKQMESTIKHEILHITIAAFIKRKRIKRISIVHWLLNIGNGCSSKSIFRLFTTIFNNTYNG